MSTAAARQLTHEHRARQLLLRKATQEQIQAVWPNLDPAALDASYQQFAGTVSVLVDKNRQTSAGLTAQYLRTYRDMAGIPGSTKIVRADALNVDQFTTSLRTTSVVAVKKSMTAGKPIDQAMRDALTQTQGSMARQVLNASRDTMTRTLQADSAARGYRRVLGGSGCDFCRMLAGRGFVYKQDTSAFDAHDHCGCTAEPEYEASSGGVFVPRVDVQATQRRLEAAAKVRELRPEARYVEKIATALRGDQTGATEAALKAALTDPATKPLSRVNISEALRVVSEERSAVANAQAAAASAARKAADEVARVTPVRRTMSPDALLSSDQYDSLAPTSQWSQEKRDAILASLRETPEGKVLADTLERFQDGGSIARLRTKIDKYLAGEEIDETSKARAESLLNAIRHSPEWAPDTLYRGMTVKGKLENVIAKYETGGTLDLNLTSFSSDRNVAKRFQSMTAKGGNETRVMVELVGEGKRTIPIQNLPKDRRLFKEKEWVSAGRYEVVEVKKSGGAVLLRIKQVTGP